MDGLIAYALSKKYVDGKTSSLATGMSWKGTKENISSLPQSGNQTGDLWHVNEDGNEYAWDGSKWEALGGIHSSNPAPFIIPIAGSDGTYTTTATAAEILDHIDNCVISLYDVMIIQPAMHQVVGSSAVILFSLSASTHGYILNESFAVIVNGSDVSIDYYIADARPTPRVAMASTDTTPTIDPNKLYVFPEMASLEPTFATPTDSSIVNEYHFIFSSGTTPTTLTIPATIRQPDGFTVEANMIYEVSILENCMTAQGWAVSA